MKISIITLFPEMFEGVFEHSMLFKAQDKGIIEINIVSLRNYGIGDRQTVDDQPYGGGDGMLLKPEPLFSAIEAEKSKSPDAKVILMTPRGKIYDQVVAQEFATQADDLIIVCARYEGYDERVTTLVDHEISVGRYVLTGGEIPAMILVDSVSRLLPGVLGGETSAEIESHSAGDLDQVEFPQYTRPEEFRGMKVPDVLLSGNHAEIQKWRNEQSKKRSDELKNLKR